MAAGFYVHLPFCKSRCSYCDFVSFAGKDDRMDDYVKALKKEIAGYSAETVDSVYFGGGTPSLFAPDTIAGMLTEIHCHHQVADDGEITMEVNPDSLTLDKAKGYLAAGVNRLSMGLQSDRDEMLRRLLRRHDRQGFLRAYQLARAAGFANINVDVMLGLPGQSAQDFAGTLAWVQTLDPEHLSVYELHVAKNTLLDRQIRSGRLKLPEEDELMAMNDALGALRGYERYEISNYAKPGFTCRHNLHYWHNERYTAVGCGAHGCLWKDGRVYRYANADSLESYLADPLAFAEYAEISPDEQAFEHIMLGLRLMEGIDLTAYQNRFGHKLLDRIGSYVMKHPDLLYCANGRLLMTNRGLDLQNTVLVELLTLWEE